MNIYSTPTIAVIGSGLSGLCAAYHLQRNYQVTLFEKLENIGGYPYPVTLKSGPDKGLLVDTGVMLVNKLSTPKHMAFLNHLNVDTRPVPMDFGFHCHESGTQYTRDVLSTLRSKIFKPGYWLFASGVSRFLKRLHEMHLAKQLENTTLGEYLKLNTCSADVLRDFVNPMASLVWQGTDTPLNDVPMLSMAWVFEYLYLFAKGEKGQWLGICGGSQTCADAFSKVFNGNIIPQAEVTSIKRGKNGVRLICEGLIDTRFDKVVIATHADRALSLLTDPSEDEKSFLSPWTYHTFPAFLHTDVSVLPPGNRSKAVFNLARGKQSEDKHHMALTIDINRMTDLDSNKTHLVTINPLSPIPKSHIIQEMTYTFPLFTQKAMNVHSRLQRLNGRRNTYYCGSYLGYGSFEDGIESALTVARLLGIEDE